MESKELIIERIMSRVKIEYLGFTINGIESPCFIWQGPTSGNGRGGGYPRMSYLGQTVAVHLLLHRKKIGPIPPKKQLDHQCTHRLCLNEDHWQIVTHLKNQRLRTQRTKEKIK